MNRILMISILQLILVVTHSFPQTYYLNINAGAGYARYITDMNQSGLNQNGIISHIRIMWEPEHLLRIGLESGYNSLYTYEESVTDTEFGSTDARSSLISIPLFLVISMEIIPSLNLTTGFGPSFLKTSFEAFGYQNESTQISTSYYVASSYSYPLNEKFSLGGEIRWYRIQKIEDGTLSLQLMFQYRLFSW
jgi:hypothetical protein